MKKHFFAFAVLLLALTCCSFSFQKSKIIKQSSYVWFVVKAGKGATNPLTDADVSFLAAVSPNPPPGPCAGSPTYNCVVGFLQSQVTGTHLNAGTQLIQIVAQRRGTI